ncbi:MAG: nucleoside-binding protein [Evtepia sp.]|jgi:basic membrane protein A|nr:nucleoside-binding protein [Evtepia sp.]
MKKRILALLMAIMMMVALVSCGTKDQPAAGGEAQAKGIAKENLKIGIILIGDEADAYNLNHVEGIKAAMKKLGVSDSQLLVKANVYENADCEAAIIELAEAGCQVIFSDSFGHEQYMLKVAPDYPNIQFCAATGVKSATDDLDNTHNYFAKIYEARYLAGVAAGLKTKTNKLGYVAAKEYAEVISGYTAYYLGAKSVNPNVEMYVNYTNEWSDAAKEAVNAKALIGLGCDVISQHSDTTAPATTAQAEGVWAVGYNADMIPAAPDAALVSARINWGVYYEYALGCMLSGEKIAQDWCKGLAEGAVYLSDLNEKVVAEGTKEAIEKAKKGILDGTIKVFAGPLYDTSGKIVVEEGSFFNENETSSAPSWNNVIKGINVLS